jgi:hypothetical protein
MRWLGFALAIGLAAVAFATVVRDRAPARAPVAAAPPESIGEASRSELERVLRESHAGEARER